MESFENGKLTVENNLNTEESQAQDKLSWLKKLEEIREKRKNTEEIFAQRLVKEEESPDSKPSFNKINNESYKFSKYLNKANPQIRNKVYQYYLQKWQQEQNVQLNDAAESQVLLANKWTLKADSILINTQAVEEESSAVFMFNEAKELQEVTTQEVDEMQKIDENLTHSMIKVTVLKPNIDPQKNFYVVDEDEFMRSVKEKLKPQLQNLLEHMIKSMLLNNYEIMLSCIQKEIQLEIPQLIEDILEHNIKNSLKK